MKIITWNVNGIRAVERKGEIQKLVEDQKPDILMIQEIKGTTDQFSKLLTEHEDYRQHYSSAEKKDPEGKAEATDNQDKKGDTSPKKQALNVDVTDKKKITTRFKDVK